MLPAPFRTQDDPTIASRLAAQMGGTLEAASVKGEGSTFTLTLSADG